MATVNMGAQSKVWGWAPVEDCFSDEVVKVDAFLATVLRRLRTMRDQLRLRLNCGLLNSCCTRT